MGEKYNIYYRSVQTLHKNFKQKKEMRKERYHSVFMHDEGISLIKCNDLRYKLCNLHTYYTIYLHYTVYIY